MADLARRGDPSIAWRLGRYYPTYPAYVEDEVKAALDDPARQFQRGPITLGQRGTATDDGPAFTVQDGTYLSARWPGDPVRPLARRPCPPAGPATPTSAPAVSASS